MLLLFLPLVSAVLYDLWSDNKHFMFGDVCVIVPSNFLEGVTLAVLFFSSTGVSFVV